MGTVVSVIIPVFNTESYIKTCYLSVANQTYTDIEIIIVNDASTDNSGAIIRKLLMNPHGRSSVRYINLEQNTSVGNARNIGLKEATGEYVMFLDSDDWINSSHVSYMLDALMFSEADIAICSILNEFENFHSSTVRYFYSNTAIINGDYALKLLSRAIRNDIYITPMVGNKLYRKSFLLNNNMTFMLNNCCEDDVFTFKIFTLHPKIVLVPKTQLHYRQRDDSITHCFSKKRIDDLIEAFISLKQYLLSNMIYEEYRIEYQSFLERCITSTYQSLIETSLPTKEKKQYLIYLLECLIAKFSLKSIVEYLDIKRIHQFLGIDY